MADAGLTDAGTSDAGPEFTVPDAYELVLFESPVDDPFTLAKSMSANGLLAGAIGDDENDYIIRPFTASLTEPVASDLPTGEHSGRGMAYGINSHGDIVGDFNQKPQAWINGVRHTLPTARMATGIARAVNDAGLIVGTIGDAESSGGLPKPYVWYSLEEGRQLKYPTGANGFGGLANDVNTAGVVVGVTYADASVAVRWDAIDQPPTELGRLPGSDVSEALAVSDSGVVVGVSSFGNPYGVKSFIFRSAQEGMKELPALTETIGFTQAFDVNNQGVVVGRCTITGGKGRAVRWYEDEVVSLTDKVTNPPAEVQYIESAQAIDAQGRIAVMVVVNRSGIERHELGVLIPVSQDE